MVGSRPVGDLQLAILSEDAALLTAVPGVGKRLAARVILERRRRWPPRECGGSGCRRRSWGG